MKRFYAKLIPAHGLCFDIGANHGKYTTLFLKCNAKVLAVEPQQNCYEDLLQQFGANDRVILIQAAVGSETARACGGLLRGRWGENTAFGGTHGQYGVHHGMRGDAKTAGRFKAAPQTRRRGYGALVSRDGRR